MSGGRKTIVALIGGTVAVALCYGAFLLGEHSPEWLGAALMVAATFAGGALIAIRIDAGR